MPQNLFKELAQLEQVEALALGGSRAGQHFDQDSDYDVYVYLSAPLEPAIRQEILSKYCSYMEIGNQFWELEDDCVLNNGIEIELIYRSLDDFDQDLRTVVLEHQAQNSYTTCMWYNLIHSKILYDRISSVSSSYSSTRLCQLFQDRLKKLSNAKTCSASITAVASFSPPTLMPSLPSMSSSIQAKSACSSMPKKIAPTCLRILKPISKTTSNISTNQTSNRKLS